MSTPIPTTSAPTATVVDPRAETVLTPDAVRFLTELHRTFEPRRRQLLADRAVRREQIGRGERPNFRAETAEVRGGSWQVSPPPADLQDRRVEITGPVERKMMINALNSGARVFMADFEDSNSPTWANVIAGQRNVHDAVRRTISLDTGDKQYTLNPEIATLVIRPRGWHLHERHFTVDGQPMSASLFDFGLVVFHNAREQLARGTGPYFYLPKLESHLEARLWNDVFCAAQDALGIARGSIRATVLIETILAAFEMDEILYELRDHSAGLNAGRWDYIFSVIKQFRDDSAFTLPDRAQVTMTAPFMRAYTELLVQTCHRRGAHAIGGMAAFIPNRRDHDANEHALTKVRDDKRREAGDGFDGTWVAHPDLVAIAQTEFDAVLGERPNQVARLREDVDTTPSKLLDTTIPGASITEAGLRNNIAVGLRYLEAWLRGTGAVAIFNLMEDAATAEISRSQVWQWRRHGARLDDGRLIDEAMVRQFIDEELANARPSIDAEQHAKGSDMWDTARSLFEGVALADDYPEFLTLSAYKRLTD